MRVRMMMIRIITQADLAEFFCEDPKTFRIEECFKAFHQFCSNFKTAVTENEKRREQERMAEQRRLQRENDQVLIGIIINIIMAEQIEEREKNLRPREDREALLLVAETTVWWRRRARRC